MVIALVGSNEGESEMVTGLFCLEVKGLADQAAGEAYAAAHHAIVGADDIEGIALARPPRNDAGRLCVTRRWRRCPGLARGVRRCCWWNQRMLETVTE